MISGRVDQMTPFIVMDVLERAKAMERDGIRVMHLEVGEPDFDAPACVQEAMVRAIRDGGHTHYTHSLGMIELREESASITAASTKSRSIRIKSSSAPGRPPSC